MRKKSFRIAFFGSSLVSAYWNGAATYYRGIIKALHRLGHRITFYEPDSYTRQEHRDIPEPEYARSVVYPADETGVFQALEEARTATSSSKRAEWECLTNSWSGRCWNSGGRTGG